MGRSAWWRGLRRGPRAHPSWSATARRNAATIGSNRVGHSAGAAVAGALGVAARMAEAGESGNVVTVLPDRADRYFEPGRWERRISW